MNTKIDGVTSNSEDDNKRMDILSLFKGLGASDSDIRELNKPIEIKKIGTDNTTLSQNTVKFLGSYAPGKVAFFTSNNGGDTPYGKITWANVVKEKYKLIDATQDELSKQFEPRTLSTNERDSFVINLVQIALNEFNYWNPEGQTPLKEDDYSTNNTVRTLLDKYWSSVTGKNFPIERSEDGRAWSAAFISYIVKTAGPTPNDFKYSTEHSNYIVDARDNTKSWKAYPSKDTPLMVGDLLCRARPTAIDLKDFNSEQDAHCDCVTALLGDRKGVAQLVGGNLDNTVKKFTVDLNTNGTVKDKDRTVILRFEQPLPSTDVKYKTSYSELPFTDPNPPSDKLSFEYTVEYLSKKYRHSVAKAVFAIMVAEARKEGDNFISPGGFNFAGVQTDVGRWGAPGIIGQYGKIDSGGKARAFAKFESSDTFLDFMANRITSKNINGENGDSWVVSYIKQWWSPKEKEEYSQKGSEKYNNKLAIYNTAMRFWDKYV